MREKADSWIGREAAFSAHVYFFLYVPRGLGLRARKRFAFGRSPRISRNSGGPLRSLRFRRARSLAGADLSLRRSISRPANLDAFAAAFSLAECPRFFRRTVIDFAMK
jgi:hypothetical protein